MHSTSSSSTSSSCNASSHETLAHLLDFMMNLAKLTPRYLRAAVNALTGSWWVAMMRLLQPTILLHSLIFFVRKKKFCEVWLTLSWTDYGTWWFWVSPGSSRRHTWRRMPGVCWEHRWTWGDFQNFTKRIPHANIRFKKHRVSGWEINFNVSCLRTWPPAWRRQTPSSCTCEAHHLSAWYPAMGKQQDFGHLNSTWERTRMCERYKPRAFWREWGKWESCVYSSSTDDGNARRRTTGTPRLQPHTSIAQGEVFTAINTALI